MSLSVSAHCLDNPGVQEEKNQDWEDSWNNWWFIRNILRKKQSSDKVRGDLLHRSVGLVLFDFSPLCVLKDWKGLTYYSGVGDQDDR